MKLFYKLSNLKESTTFPHDAQLIKGVQIGLLVFLILSSLTVFSGVKSHLAEYLIDSFILWRWFVYGASYLVGSLGIDLVNTVCLAYIISAILRKDFETESIILIVCCTLLCVGLTHYSFSMSQNSAVVLGNDLKEEKQQDDSQQLTRLDTTLNNQLAVIESTYKENYNRTITPFNTRIDNINKTYDNQIAILQNEIAVIDANTTKDNYLYAAKQKKPVSGNIQKLESEKLAALSPVLIDQQKAIDKLTAEKSEQIAVVQNFHKADRNRTTSKTDDYNNQVKETSNIFSTLFGQLSGYSVFALLLLAAIREVLFFRNGIEPEPILSNFDFSPSWMIEVASYPLVWVRRHSINKVRKWYEELPALKQPVIQSEIWDGSSLGQHIIEPEEVENKLFSPPEDVPMGSSRPLKAKGTDYIFASIPATSGGETNGVEIPLSQYSHEKEKSRGIGTHEKPTESTGTGTHETTTKSILKIKHIGKNEKEYWYDKKQVEGKIKKYRANVREWGRKAHRKKATDRDRKALENNRSLLGYWEGRINEF